MLRFLRSPRVSALSGAVVVPRRLVSKTVNIMGLPTAVVRDEMYTLCQGFGKISCLMINQAFSGKSSMALVTFQNVGSAIAMVDEMHLTPLLGRHVTVKFSTR